MFEAVLPISIYFINSIAGSIYVQKLLRGKYQKKIVLFAWASLYFIIQSLVLENMGGTYPFNDLVKVIADIAFVLLLQMLMYNKDLLKQLFVAVSFVAGKEIIKHIIVVLIYGQYFVSNKILAVFSEKIIGSGYTNMSF